MLSHAYESLKSNIRDFAEASTNEGFQALAFELFEYQSKNNLVYKQFLSFLSQRYQQPQRIEDIPLMPIAFFKNYDVMSDQWQPETTFLSSGTGNQNRSKHHVRDSAFYNYIAERLFRQGMQIHDGFNLLTLLPSYIENGNSSLVHMATHLHKCARNANSEAFFLYDFERLHEAIQHCLSHNDKPTILLGVTFALIDFAQAYLIDSDRLEIVFTGGMKNRKREMSFDEIYQTLSVAFPNSTISAEYGMTELFSQAYAKGNAQGVYHPGRTLQVMCKELTDPLANVKAGKLGQIGCIDLANIDSCAFILTQDLGKKVGKGFNIIGRLQNSDIRGCHLLYET